ncbi:MULTISPECIES: hypothetical protein [Euryhalocaulis]|uniref:hypothetical protein n=1 Tax=Euryhalocaulis TaxID=1712422 RepID=UPI00039CEEDB|nr:MULTISPECIES: hypothetical protein [Euryhalocaulis]MBA4801752.1 hypothetical protein [Euryhalocaulis sp.]
MTKTITAALIAVSVATAGLAGCATQPAGNDMASSADGAEKAAKKEKKKERTPPPFY